MAQQAHAPHLFVDISSHGFGHLAQTAPVLNRLAELRPDIRITLRSGLPEARLRQRIRIPFAHIAAASDFGYVMIDALHIDHAASAAAYRAASADFSARVAADVTLFEKLGVDAVFANVSYIPLAAAGQTGRPAVALCSLNWADLFAHYFGREDWAPLIHTQLLAAYRCATFLRTTPSMPMPDLVNQRVVGPIASRGQDRRTELRQKLGAGETAHPTRIVLVALGGIPTRLPVEDWPHTPDTHWIVPAEWRVASADFHAIETLGWPFADLLRSVDAIVTKPGYGTFAEAARNGTAVLYQRRSDWPEQEPLIDWLHAHARAREIDGDSLQHGQFTAALDAVLQTAVPPSATAKRASSARPPCSAEALSAPTFRGADEAAQYLAALLK
jgi:hypothetical protein